MKGLGLLLPVLVALQVGVQPAFAWTWPVDGPVLRPFALGDDPYAGGQHRGIDIGAPAGTPVQAPISGSVSFAGVVPTGGKTITIRTTDGLAVTLQHLGSYTVARGAPVTEGDVLASVGEGAETYVYLGVRRADEPNGYVDPLGLLPPPAPAPLDPEPSEPDPVPLPAQSSGAKHHELAHGLQPVGEGPSSKPARELRLPARPARDSSPVLEPDHGNVRPQRSAQRARLPFGAADPARVTAGVAPGLQAPKEASSNVEGTSASRHPSRFAAAAGLVLLLSAGALSAGAWSARRRQLGNARAAHRPAAMLLQRAPATAEDTDGLRLGKENHVVLHRDLERILLGESEALANLDRDHDPAQVVDMADDPRLRCSPRRARSPVALVRSVRPQRRFHPFGYDGLRLKQSPRFAISNRHLPLRGRVESFV
jgi:Peptidase family M23